MRSLWMPLALLGLLWAGVTCAQLPAEEATSLSGARELLASACEGALARLAPAPEPEERTPVSFPVEVGPALRALHGTGMGGRVAALEAAVERAARLALADAKPLLERAVAEFVSRAAGGADRGRRRRALHRVSRGDGGRPARRAEAGRRATRSRSRARSRHCREFATVRAACRCPGRSASIWCRSSQTRRSPASSLRWPARSGACDRSAWRSAAASSTRVPKDGDFR